MATRVHLKATSTVFEPEFGDQNNHRDFTAAAGTVGGAGCTFSFTTSVPGFPDERPTAIPTIGFVSDRLVAEAAISGQIAFSVWTMALNDASWVARLRFRLYKVTSGGSMVETLIGTADAAANFGVNNVDTQYTFNMTPVATVTLAANERFILRPSLFNPGGGTVSASAGVPRLKVSAASGAGFSYIDFTETFTLKPNVQQLYLRQTTVNAIGNFYDLSTTKGSSNKTGVVNTTASGTNIQWTRTAGGTALEWITKRLNESWVVVGPSGPIFAGGTFWCHESAGQANCAARYRLFRRQPDGNETEFFLRSLTTEFGTSSAAQVFVQSAPTDAITLAKDDRVVVRLYIINASGQTMDAGRTCTVTYDGATGGAAGDSFLNLPNLAMKEETDPPESGVMPSGLSMSGLGNGQ